MTMDKILGYGIKKTCSACPEQYEVWKDGKEVGYLRLRHGHFTAEVTSFDPSVLVYGTDTLGDGTFFESERDIHLRNAINKIDIHLKRNGLIKRTQTKGNDMEKTFSLEVTKEELISIAAIQENVVGCPEASPRRYFDTLGTKLKAGLKHYGLSSSDVPEATDLFKYFARGSLIGVEDGPLNHNIVIDGKKINLTTTELDELKTQLK